MLPVTIESKLSVRSDGDILVVYQSGEGIHYGNVFTDEQPSLWRRVWDWFGGQV